MFLVQGKASRTTLVTLASLAILITLAVLFLPSGFSNDVSKIGKGAKIAVFAYNNGTTNSMDMMNLMEKVRSSYQDKLDFIAVSVTAPIGKKFLKDYNVRQSYLVLFNGNGTVASTLMATEDENLLRQTLDSFLQN